VYDPCCGSGGMFVQSQKFVDAHGGKLGNISIYGQESNPTNRRLAAMNLAIRGIDFDLGSSAADTFEHDLHKDLKFDYILMNPPFGREESYPREKLLNDVRWKRFGVPREKPSNYAWLSHAIHHMSSNGKAAIVMPRISLVAAQGGDDKMRKAFVEANIVEAIIDLPAQLFFNTVIPSCIWVFNQNKSRLPENVRKKILFIDARKMGSDISSTQIEFGDEEIKDIAELHTAWSNGYEANIDGFSYSASIADIEKYSFNLTPAKYVGSDGSDDNELHSDEDFMTLVREIELLSIRGAELDKQIFDRFKRSGYGN
jgi:type I restriction enzyme M protein